MNESGTGVPHSKTLSRSLVMPWQGASFWSAALLCRFFADSCRWLPKRSQARVNGFAFQGEDGEDGFVDSAQGFFADEAF